MLAPGHHAEHEDGRHQALAALAKEPVPDYISAAYDGVVMRTVPNTSFKPFDRRVLIWEAAGQGRR